VCYATHSFKLICYFCHGGRRLWENHSVLLSISLSDHRISSEILWANVVKFAKNFILVLRTVCKILWVVHTNFGVSDILFCSLQSGTNWLKLSSVVWQRLSSSVVMWKLWCPSHHIESYRMSENFVVVFWNLSKLLVIFNCLPKVAHRLDIQSFPSHNRV